MKIQKEVSSGATVITSKEAITILRKREIEKGKPKNYKRKKRSDEAPFVEADVAEENIEDVIEHYLDLLNEELDFNLTLGSEEGDLLNELQREEENLADERYLFRTTNNVRDWILVKYDVKEKSSKVKHYVGIIQEIHDDMLKVKFVLN